MTVTPIRPSTRTAEAVDFEALTEAQLRVIFYAANYHRYADDMKPDKGFGRMMRTITAVVGDLGLDLIREVGDLAAYAVLTRDYEMQAQLFPDKHRWDWTTTSAWVFRQFFAQKPAFLIVHAVTERWHAALAGTDAQEMAA